MGAAILVSIRYSTIQAKQHPQHIKISYSTLLCFRWFSKIIKYKLVYSENTRVQYFSVSGKRISTSTAVRNLVKRINMSTAGEELIIDRGWQDNKVEQVYKLSKDKSE